MTLAYRCSNCGTLLATTNADPLHDQIAALVKALEECLLDTGNISTANRIRRVLGAVGGVGKP